MANEGTFTVGLNIRKGNLQYTPPVTNFRVDVDGSKGPTPGAVTISVTGTDIDFSELDIPGPARILNLDSTNFVTFGIFDPETNKFYPIGEILPGEVYPIRFSRYLADEFGTGSGTTGPHTNRLRFMADTAACDVSVEAFEA